MLLRDLGAPARTSLWLARHPRHDESLSSFLDAAAQLYGVRRVALVRELSGGRARRGADLDAAEPMSLWTAVARRFGIPLDEILKRAVPEPYWLLPSYARTAYCPLCFERDLTHQRTPYFRREWSYGLVTLCLRDRTPLHEWASRVDGQRVLPNDWLVTPSLERGSPASFLNALREAKELSRHALTEDAAVLEGFQQVCDRAGLNGGRTIPTKVEIERRYRIRHYLRKALGDLEPPCILRQGHLDFPDIPHVRIPRRARPLGRYGRIWAASKVAFQDVAWRRSLLLPLALEERTPSLL